MLIYSEWLGVTHVLDLHGVTREARSLHFGTPRRLVRIGEGTLHRGDEEVDLGLDRHRLGFDGKCAAHK